MLTSPLARPPGGGLGLIGFLKCLKKSAHPVYQRIIKKLLLSDSLRHFALTAFAILRAS